MRLIRGGICASSVRRRREVITETISLQTNKGSELFIFCALSYISFVKVRSEALIWAQREHLFRPYFVNIREKCCQSSAAYPTVVTTGRCILDGRALLSAYTYTFTLLHISSHRTVLLQTSTRLHQILVSVTSCFHQLFPPGLRSELLSWSIVVSLHISRANQVGSYLRTVAVPFANQPVILAFLLLSSPTSVVCRLSCPACYHLSGLREFCSELHFAIVVTS